MPNPSDVRALVDEAREQATACRKEADCVPLDCFGERDFFHGLAASFDRLASALEARECLPDEATPEMRMAGARSIGASMHRDNHTERAELCWRDMVKAFRSGTLPAAPTTTPNKDYPCR